MVMSTTRKKKTNQNKTQTPKFYSSNSMSNAIPGTVRRWKRNNKDCSYKM